MRDEDFFEILVAREGSFANIRAPFLKKTLGSYTPAEAGWKPGRVRTVSNDADDQSTRPKRTKQAEV
jgi:hypothetical protein